MKKDYMILTDNGTRTRDITEAEAMQIVEEAYFFPRSLSEDEKDQIEASLLGSDTEADTWDDAECIAVKLGGTWCQLPEDYR